MKPRVYKRPRVERDLMEHFSYIARDKIQPALKFLEVAEQTFERLAEMPGLGREWESPSPHLSDIRVYPMPRYRNYLVFYRPREDGVEIL